MAEQPLQLRGVCPIGYSVKPVNHTSLHTLLQSSPPTKPTSSVNCDLPRACRLLLQRLIFNTLPNDCGPATMDIGPCLSPASSIPCPTTTCFAPTTTADHPIFLRQPTPTLHLLPQAMALLLYQRIVLPTGPLPTHAYLPPQLQRPAPTALQGLVNVIRDPTPTRGGKVHHPQTRRHALSLLLKPPSSGNHLARITFGQKNNGFEM